MLYKGLIHPFSETLASITQLVFIPDGALQSLPPHLLTPLADSVDARDVATYGHAEWLGLRIPVSIAPSASAIVATRATNRSSTATRELLGFGDPVFTGARRVPVALAPHWAAVRAGTVKRSDIARLQRLPQTRNELNAIARILGPDRSDLFLGDDASERWLAAVRTDDYRVISFASHALMPGELPGLREPAIVLTPDPDEDSIFDGLLTPAEIAQLRLDADLVILSACNTAAADGSGLGEGLSGLGRAFFFAGARSLLVSHWAVEATVTAALIADVVARTRQEPAQGAAAALAGAMRGTFGAETWLQHPAFWAAFVVVAS